jgi:2,4'-dihydroxyacetophenone dioxygenase
MGRCCSYNLALIKQALLGLVDFLKEEGREIMVAIAKADAINFIFDDSQISWGPFPYVENAEFSLYDFDEERRVIDLLFKFEANKKITVHTHIQQTNMLIIQGELRIYETDGSIKEVRRAGQYFRGRKDDTHSEGGGPEGAVVFYSIRGDDREELLDVIDEKGQVIATIKIDDVRAMWEAKSKT